MEGQVAPTAHNPCLLIPIYNQGPLVEATLARLRPLQLPCLIVDDGSDAATAAVLDGAVAREDWILLRRLPENRGKGSGGTDRHCLGARAGVHPRRAARRRWPAHA